MFRQTILLSFEIKEFIRRSIISLFLCLVTSCISFTNLSFAKTLLVIYNELEIFYSFRDLESDFRLKSEKFKLRMIMDVGILRSLSRTEFSGVVLLVDHEMTLSLDKSFSNAVPDGISQVLAGKLRHFDPRY